tara:strand:+ start:2709 stop:5123 length:2415 start_codon:yes stop_codon:yes gene_type:complete
MFNQIILTETGYAEGKKLHTIECNNYDKSHLDCEYINKLNNLDYGYELIGKKGQQIKPCFDCDPKFNIDDEVDVLKTINDVILKVDKMYPNTEKYAIMRIRKLPDENKQKVSFHITIDGVRTNIQTIKKKINDNGYKKDETFDDSIYTPNRGLYPIYSNKKKGTVGSIEVFKAIDIKTGKILNWPDIDIKKYCPSYVEENFKQDFMEPPTGPKGPTEEIDKIQYDDDTAGGDFNLEEIINHLKPHRAENRDDWLNGIYCVINCAESRGYGKKKQKDIAHLFSSISKEKYEEDTVDEWLDKNFDKKREIGYRWTFLLNWLKEDDITYHNSIISVSKNKLIKYDEFKKDWETNHFKLLHPPFFITIENDGIICEKNNDAMVTYEHLTCTITNKAIKKMNDEAQKSNPNVVRLNEEEPKWFFPIWKKDHTMKIHRKMSWLPPPLVMDHPNDFNLFEDFSIKQTPLIETEINYWDEYYKLASNLFGDKKITNYVISIMASRLQTPAFRTEVLVILTGAEGDGKSLFINTYFKLFDKYTAVIQNLNNYFEDKSTLEYQKLLLCLDDVSGNGNFEHDGQLRSKITSSTLTVRPLYENAKSIDNYCDLWYSSNQRNIVKMTDDGIRRFFQTETTSHYRNNTDYWNWYLKHIYKTNKVFNPIALRQIYEGLMNWDISEHIIKSFQDPIDKPLTDIMKQNIRSNRDKILYFYEDLTQKNEKENEKRIADKDDVETDVTYENKILFDKWNQYCLKSKITSEMNIIQFGIKTTAYIKKIEIKTGEIAFKKDSKHSLTTVYFKVLREFFDKLNEGH